MRAAVVLSAGGGVWGCPAWGAWCAGTSGAPRLARGRPGLPAWVQETGNGPPGGGPSGRSSEAGQLSSAPPSPPCSPSLGGLSAGHWAGGRDGGSRERRAPGGAVAMGWTLGARPSAGTRGLHPRAALLAPQGRGPPGQGGTGGPQGPPDLAPPWSTYRGLTGGVSASQTPSPFGPTSTLSRSASKTAGRAPLPPACLLRRAARP